MLDIELILNKLQSFGFLRIHKQVGNYMQIYCPFHNDGNERKPSCGVLLNEEYRNGRKYPQGFTHCFSCGYAKSLPDMISDLLKSKSISQTGLDWLIENIPGFSPEYESELEYLIPNNLISSLNIKYAVDYIQSMTKPKTEYVSEEILASYRFTVPYMYERKLTDEIIEKFDVGYDANWIAPGRKQATPCITFPVRDRDGNTLFIYRRSVGGKFFHAPTGTTKPVYGLYELPKGCKSVIICESIINCLTCWVWGYLAVALLGTGNAFQIQQLKELGVNEFVICLDGDDAGMRGTEKLKRALKSTALIWSIQMISGKDVNDLEKHEFDELYENRG